MISKPSINSHRVIKRSLDIMLNSLLLDLIDYLIQFEIEAENQRLKRIEI